MKEYAIMMSMCRNGEMGINGREKDKSMYMSPKEETREWMRILVDVALKVLEMCEGLLLTR